MITHYKFIHRLILIVLLILIGPGLIVNSYSAGIINQSNINLSNQQASVNRPLLSDFLNKDADEKVIPPLKKLIVTGFYRSLVYTRTMDDAYTQAFEPQRVVMIADGYREPMLNLNIGANPTKDTYFNYQMFFFPTYPGPTNNRNIDNANRTLSLQFGVTINGTIKTKLGKYDVTMGGSNWQRISHLTLWQNEGFNRFSTFDRRPWDDPTSTARYKDFNEQGTINQDVRWGRRPFQGVFIEGTNMPKKTGMVFFYGKTDNNGGGLSYLSPTYPDQFIGGRLSKNFGKNSISYNTFNRFANKDSVKDVFVGYDIHTIQYVYFYKLIKFTGEVGIGSYTDPKHPQHYSEGINLGVVLPKKYTFLPLNFQFFQIGPNFINLNSIVYNTSIIDAQQQSSGLANSQSIFPFNSPIVEIGQLTNNRKGLNLNTEYKIGKLRINLGYANTMEMSHISNALSYNHRINALAVSRINPFVMGKGPYGRINTMFRGYYETVNLTDSSLKHFNTLEVQGKYGSKLMKKDLFIFYTGYFNSVQPMFSLFNKFNDDAFLRVMTNEFDLYYNVIPKVMLVGYYGLERVMGNNATDINTSNANATNTISNDKKHLSVVTKLPRNQIGQGIGVGLDFDIGKDIGLYFRHRWMKYEDLNFGDDQYHGTESTIEIKATF
jgi:hypothetical protein